MDYVKIATELHEQGLAVIPTGINKNPLESKWQTFYGDNRVTPNGNFENERTRGVGAITGVPVEGDSLYLIALDVDCYDKVISRELCDYIAELNGAPMPYRVGEAPKFLVPVLIDQEIPKRTSIVFDNNELSADGKPITSKVEVLGKGQQFVAYGRHPEAKGKKYAWFNGTLDVDHLPRFSLEQVEAVIDKFEELAYEYNLQPVKTASSVSDDPFAGMKKSDVSLEEAQEILSFISPDCDYETWFRVGAALHNEFDGDFAALDLWRDWSEESEKAAKNTGANNMKTKWDSFQRDSGSKVAFGTVCEYAKNNGADLSYISQQFKPALLAPTYDKRFFKASEFSSDITPPNWLVKSLMERDTLNMLFGSSGVGKSYYAVGLACCVAAGIDFHGNQTKPANVVFMAGEGGRGLKARIKAVYQDANTDISDRLLVTTNITDFSSTEDLKLTVSQINDIFQDDVGLIVIDTLARASGAFDENSTQDMNKFVRACDWLRRKFNGAAILIIHHTSKGNKAAARGSTVLKGAMDTEFMVESADAGVIVSCTKAKDIDPFEPQGYGFKRVDFPDLYDEDGHMMHSHVLIPAEVEPDSEGKTPLSPTGKEVFKAFVDTFEHHPELRCQAPAEFAHRDGLDSPAEGLSVDDVREVFYRSQSSHHHVRQKWNRGIQDCQNKAWLGVFDEVIVRL